MQEIFGLILGVIIILIGFPLGYLLAKYTKEELKSGQKWFKTFIILAAITSIIGLSLGNDPLFFSSLFFIAVTSQSLKKEKTRN